MVVLSLDTHELVKELIGAGFTEEQAEAVTRAVVAARDLDLSHLATKDDLEALEQRLRGEIESLRDEMHREIEALRREMQQEIGALRSEMQQEIGALRNEMRTGDASLRAELEILKRDMTIRLGAMIAAAVALITALDRLI
ncbi:MAG: coiled-coil domain-containing protein [Geminicoccaceae bacterium]|nr:coiled-coil domain-containing protein [Geminicoccaceae bacterium]